MEKNKKQEGFNSQIKLTCSIPKPLHKLIKEMARDEHTTISRIVNLALQQYVTQKIEDAKSVDQWRAENDKWFKDNRVS